MTATNQLFWLALVATVLGRWWLGFTVIAIVAMAVWWAMVMHKGTVR